jgi:hypothetical protein
MSDRLGDLGSLKPRSLDRGFEGREREDDRALISVSRGAGFRRGTVSVVS